MERTKSQYFYSWKLVHSVICPSSPLLVHIECACLFRLQNRKFLEETYLSGTVSVWPILCKLTHSRKHWVLYTNITTCIFYLCFSKEFLVKFAYDMAHLALCIVKSSNAVAMEDYSVYQMKRCCDRQCSQDNCVLGI